MLRKINRLPAGQKLDNAKSFSTEYFRVLIKPNDSSDNRFGFVVGKRVDKRAVVRNRLKRVLREAATGFLTAEKSYDALFIVTKSFFDIPTEKIYKQVKDILQNL